MVMLRFTLMLVEADLEGDSDFLARSAWSMWAALSTLFDDGPIEYDPGETEPVIEAST